VLDMLGIDKCVDYRAGDFAEQLKAAFPAGIDVYSDGIGGALTETVTASMNQNSRLFSYGGAAAYYADKLDAPQQRPSLRRAFGISENVDTILKKRNIKSECWIVDTFYHERLKAEDDLSRQLRSGALKPISNVVDGFDNLPDAVVSLYREARAGKLRCGGSARLPIWPGQHCFSHHRWRPTSWVRRSSSTAASSYELRFARKTKDHRWHGISKPTRLSSRTSTGSMPSSEPRWRRSITCWAVLDVRDENRNRLVRPLQQKVKARKLWACHLAELQGGAEGYCGGQGRDAQGLASAI
jgi:hypothetical protein